MKAIDKDKIDRIKAVANSVADVTNSVIDLTMVQAIIDYDLNAPTRHLDFSPIVASDDEDPLAELLLRIDQLEERVATLEGMVSSETPLVD